MTIRRTPEDFRVVEELREGFVRGLGARDATRRIAVYRLEKRGMSTPGACAKLARALGVRAASISWAGLKDVHALTTQHVGVRDAMPDVPHELGEESWRARLVGWASRPADAADIERNRFEITVRDLTRARAVEMHDRAAALTSEGGLLIVNYFGEQRFASAAHGKGFAGAALVKGHFETALRLLVGTPTRKESGRRRAITSAYATHWSDWRAVVAACPRGAERRPAEVLAAGGDFRAAFAALPNLTQVMAVEAYQSLLWNRASARLLRMACPRTITAPTPFGELVFPFPTAVPGALHHLTAPLPSPETPLEGRWGEAMGAELAAEGLVPGDLRIPGLRRPTFGHAERPLLVRAEEFSLGEPEPDELAARPGRLKRRAAFALRRGAYATVVLRALGE